MTNYFDNQNIWSWNITDKEIKVETDHGTHTHTVDLKNATIGDMYDNLGETIGNAHRAASHDDK